MFKCKKKNGYVLLATIAITLVLTIIVIALLTIVYRYASSISKNLEDLRKAVISISMFIRR